MNKVVIYIAVAIVLVVFIAMMYTHSAATAHMPVQNQTQTKNVTQGQRISNFVVGMVNSNNVTGMLYIQYPVARLNATNETLNIGDSVGYACDGTLARLVGIHDGTASFALNTTKSKYGCPI